MQPHRRTVSAIFWAPMLASPDDDGVQAPTTEPQASLDTAEERWAGRDEAA